mgnify:CR=1 FL=1
MKWSVLAICPFLLCSCGNKQGQVTQGNWIKGTEQEKLKITENQFRGFDMAMVETGYRYQELYWAGQDGNWEYAGYQLEKIQKAIENGLQRRPKRAASAEHFLQVALPEMKKAVESRDTLVFSKEFRMFTANCTACHVKEKVPYFTVREPMFRQSPIRGMEP